MISFCFFLSFQASTPRRPRPLPWRRHNQRRKDPWTRLLSVCSACIFRTAVCTVHDSSPHFPPASCLPAVSFRRQNGSSAREMLSLLQEQALPQVEVQQVQFFLFLYKLGGIVVFFLEALLTIPPGRDACLQVQHYYFNGS
jgi:hypothetical protein